MPVTIQIQFNDDAEVLHDLATIPEADFDFIRHNDHVEYRIKMPTIGVHELADLVDMTETRLWHFNWLKAGKDGGLSVRRAMSFDRMSEGLLVLRTADIAKRLD